MANLNVKELRTKLRMNLDNELPDSNDAPDVLSAFDRAWADTVTDLVDGNAAPEPKKRTYQRKKKVTTEPTTE